MARKSFIIILLFIGIGIAVAEGLPQHAWQWAARFEVTNRLLGAFSNQQLLPGPLRGSLDTAQGTLTRDGVIDSTNKQRRSNGLPSLRMNPKLNVAAQAKLDDLFAQQYFEHVSPQGVAPADVITDAGYRYIVVGENLALGNFKDDVTLVQAWMDSPGHRANILHSRFQEIGVAVRKGTYEGKSVWIAVQEFGTPISACPGPSDALKDTIDADREQITLWQAELERLKTKMETSRYESVEAYNMDAQRYNELAAKTNALIDQTRTHVEEYNRQVNMFNQCVEQDA